jgi:hypothetical protein
VLICQIVRSSHTVLRRSAVSVAFCGKTLTALQSVLLQNSARRSPPTAYMPGCIAVSHLAV